MSGAGEPPELAAGLDEAVREAMACLGEAGFFGGEPGIFPAADYHAFAERVRASFIVPQTSITTAAARLLFGISASARPRRIAAMGSYFGNMLVWLLGAHSQASALGCDTDAHAVEGARDNFRRLAGPQPTFRVEDALAFLSRNPDPIDLLLIDVDDPVSRKRLYADLLIAALPRLAPGALVLAHDRFEKRFREDFDTYLNIAHDSHLFALSTGIPIDSAGFELSRRGTGAPSAVERNPRWTS